MWLELFEDVDVNKVGINESSRRYTSKCNRSIFVHCTYNVVCKVLIMVSVVSLVVYYCMASNILSNEARNFFSQNGNDNYK